MFADAYFSSLGYLCYNEPLFSGLLSGCGHKNKLYLANFYCLKPLLSEHRTELTIVVLDCVLEIRTEVS